MVAQSSRRARSAATRPGGHTSASGVDVAVVGLGPAGRALAHRLLAHGARVLAVDPEPDRAWQQTFGGWAGQLPDWLPEDVVGARAPRTVLQAHGRRPLHDEYVVLDTARLQQALSLDGARIRRERVADRELAALAPVVVDARGSRPLLDGPHADVAVQTAFGMMLRPEQATALLTGSDGARDGAVLMDWRCFDGAPSWGDRPASFCYTIPMPDGQVLVEETVLAALPPVGVDELARRLRVRLAAHGITPDDATATELVWIPMLPQQSGHRLPRFGTAGAQLNPISGYSLFASLAQADAAARHLLQHGTVPKAPRGSRLVRRLALGAVLGLTGDETVDLFEAFSRLPRRAQQAVLDPAAPTSAVLSAMAGQWCRMGPSRPALVRATAFGPWRLRPRARSRAGQAWAGPATRSDG